ncbi:fimbrial biogenesis chaperone [Pseudomonas kuykendallii]|uniref:Pili assembly chaperone n=1 Tax=Pseudomonas kuykendallii TaxID=1007099 RepID=A0A2W5EZC0_9PSED|nr:molecular chaperone [Pseudomonas kuykendallii]PZP24262.1 MAG: pili assembly chaperone [Pseudomonas kuykendallii]
MPDARSSRHFRIFRRLLGVLGFAGLLGSAQAATSVLIWPINPVIEGEGSGVALWLENRGDAPVKLQTRVLDWKQQGFADQLGAQQGVVASPPIISVEPGKRQLIRLIRRQPAPPGVEQAYRVLVDELIPEGGSQGDKAGVQFQMRYSVPLFVYGAGLAAPKDGAAIADDKAAAVALSYRVESEGGRRWLRLHNAGSVHARLSEVRLVQGGKAVPVAEGLLGYVLPGADMRWLMPEAVQSGAFTLEARVNERSDPQTIGAR